MKKKTNRSRNFQAVQNPENTTIKEIKPEKKRKKRYLLLYLAIIGFAFYAVITGANGIKSVLQGKATPEEAGAKIVKDMKDQME